MVCFRQTNKYIYVQWNINGYTLWKVYNTIIIETYFRMTADLLMPYVFYE